MRELDVTQNEKKVWMHKQKSHIGCCCNQWQRMIITSWNGETRLAKPNNTNVIMFFLLLCVPQLFSFHCYYAPPTPPVTKCLCTFLFKSRPLWLFRIILFQKIAKIDRAFWKYRLDLKVLDFLWFHAPTLKKLRKEEENTRHLQESFVWKAGMSKSMARASPPAWKAFSDVQKRIHQDVAFHCLARKAISMHCVKFAAPTF